MKPEKGREKRDWRYKKRGRLQNYWLKSNRKKNKKMQKKHYESKKKLMMNNNEKNINIENTNIKTTKDHNSLRKCQDEF